MTVQLMNDIHAEHKQATPDVLNQQ